MKVLLLFFLIDVTTPAHQAQERIYYQRFGEIRDNLPIPMRLKVWREWEAAQVCYERFHVGKKADCEREFSSIERDEKK